MGKWIIKVQEVTYHTFQFEDDGGESPFSFVHEEFCNERNIEPDFTEYGGRSITEKIKLDDNDRIVYHEYVD